MPQVKTFLNTASRELRDADISQIREVVTKQLQHTFPLLEAIGKTIVELHKFEAEIDYEQGRRYPTIPSLISPPDRIFPSHPLSHLAADEPEASSSAPLSSTSLTALPRSPSFPFLTATSPTIRELIRFIETSAPEPFSLNELLPHERAYRVQVEEDPEKFSCFREQNSTYRRILTTLERQATTGDPLFLARWMMWRVYAWGLKDVQDMFVNNLRSGRDVFTARQKIRVSKADGNNAIKVKTYGSQFGPNVPSDLNRINKIWKGGVEIWADWQEHLPVSFASAEESFASTDMPIYGAGALSQILLYGDMVRLGIVVSPTAGEMANLLSRANSGAMRGLEILGWRHEETALDKALDMLRETLNRDLSPAAKGLFHGGEVGLFDIEHTLCKVARKQRNKQTKSPEWPKPMTKRAISKRKIDQLDSDEYVDDASPKRRKVIRNNPN